jgi:hypothetical protein
MLIKISACGTTIVALVAGKRLLARVCPLMGAEIAAPGAAKVALVAGKRLLGLHRPLGNPAERLVADIDGPGQSLQLRPTIDAAVARAAVACSCQYSSISIRMSS